VALRFLENLCTWVLVNTVDTNFHENLSSEGCNVLFRQMDRHEKIPSFCNCSMNMLEMRTLCVR
jgi:hypothetical protein